MIGRFVAIAAALGLLFVPAAQAATTDTATAAASPGPYLVGVPITFTSTTPCTVPCRLIWTFLNGTRLGDQIGEGTSVSQAFPTPGLKTVELRLTEQCVGTTRLVCASTALVSVFVEAAPTAEDTTPPTFSVAGVEVEATGPNTPVNYTFSASDPDDAVASQSCAPPPRSSFPVGTSSIACTATDSHGNIGSQTFDVVVNDSTPPALDPPAPITKEATSAAGAVVDFAVSASDLVDGAVTPSCSHASGSTFALGSTAVTCTATDAHGNSSSAGFDVAVTDRTPPTLTVPGPIAVAATSPAGAAVTYTATATDLVDGAVAPSCSPASGSVFAAGTTTVSCTATDAHGNTAAAQTFSVHVAGAAEQLDALLQQVLAWNLRDQNLATKLQSLIRTMTDRPARGCRALADLDDALAGSLGRKLGAARTDFVRGELARIGAVAGCT